MRISDRDANALFVQGLGLPNWRQPVSEGRRKEWNPKKRVSRRARRHKSKNRRRKAWRLSAQHSSDFFREKLQETSFARKVLPVVGETKPFTKEDFEEARDRIMKHPIPSSTPIGIFVKDED